MNKEAKIKEILFPEPILVKDGKFPYHLDSSADNNLLGVLCDIELNKGRSDDVCIKTLKEIHKKLEQVRTILEDVDE